MSFKGDILKLTDAYFHVYNRGSRRGNIFFKEKNYFFLLSLMQQYYDRSRLLIISYCLIPNHYHIFIQQLQPNAISDFIKGIFNTYVKAINQQENRSGTLFEGKYKIKLVNRENYLIHLSRYIHMNPVIHGLVAKPEDWYFSSYQEYIGMRKNLLCEPESILKYFSNIDDYVQFVRDYKPENRKEIESYLFD